MGKPAGADLLEGKLTLPLIILREKMPSMRSTFERIMLRGTYKVGEREQISEEMLRSGALGEARELANSYANAARKSLEILPKTEYLQALGEIPEYVVHRGS
ncbi:hypothetical protein [Leptolyngbya sp. 7M]|uniref:hypothetical protein n=1 Tax=Leptolyngbya sp. 7M TaxID=2812896 RepID=UPI001B8B9A81|nr:hypothetical protein [Leptolyngbya sp. 7M]QYO68664.1 hypothetical protein JVX88_25870 [Leptolyngbya sp. 7M]